MEVGGLSLETKILPSLCLIEGWKKTYTRISVKNVVLQGKRLWTWQEFSKEIIGKDCSWFLKKKLSSIDICFELLFYFHNRRFSICWC